MSAQIYDLATRSATSPFPHGDAVMRASMRVFEPALGARNMKLVLTGPSTWSIRTQQGAIGRLLRVEDQWHLAARPHDAPIIRKAFADALETCQG